MTEHLAASWWFYSAAKGADKTGPLAGVPYDGADPQYADLYWAGNEQPKEHYYCPHGAGLRQADVVQPDQGHDRPLPSRPALFRQPVAVSRRGRPQAAGPLLQRQRARGTTAGWRPFTTASRIPRAAGCRTWNAASWTASARSPGRPTPAWAAGTTTSILAKRHGYKTPATVIQMLCDIVSKNGNLLLNFPPRPDGTLDDDELKILDAMAAWMPVNGEAIFGTRPWKVLWRRPVASVEGRHFNEGKLQLHRPGHPLHAPRAPTLYAIALGWPEDGRLRGSLAGRAAGQDHRRHAAWATRASSTGRRPRTAWS